MEKPLFASNQGWVGGLWFIGLFGNEAAKVKGLAGELFYLKNSIFAATDGRTL